MGSVSVRGLTKHFGPEVAVAGIDFDAPDGQPANILFGLLVPEACNDAHLQILAGLAAMFSDAELRNVLSGCSGEAALREAMLSWKASSPASA